MALPTGTTQGTGRSRSEAAIEAWKHRQRAVPKTAGGLDPKIAARVKEILASKQKGKQKPKGKAPKKVDPAKAKAKEDRAKEQAAKKVEREKAKAERLTAAAAKKTERDKAKVERVAAQAKKQQATLKKQKAAAQAQRAKAKAGAAAKNERTKQTQAKQAAQQQRKTRVLAEKVKRGEKLSASDQIDAEDAGIIKAGKAMTDLDTLAIKAGARHSRTDLQHIQAIHDSSVACGADCAPGDAAAPDEQDTEDAGKAIKGIMDNPLYYAQHECGDIMQAANALSTMAMLIQSELMEEDEDQAHVAMLCDAAHTLVDFIDSELDELEGASKDAAADASMGAMNKGIELATLEDGEQLSIVHGYSVKSLNDDGLVGGYLVKFGGDGDLSTTHDIFTKNTNYGSHTKSAVWVHHRMLPGVGKRQLTNEAELGMDDEGVFVKHLLDLRNVYEAKLYDMAKNNKLGWSSGTAPNLVERKALGDGRHEIIQWPLGLDASYTPMPAGGFVVNASAMKSLFEDAGIDLLNAIYIDDSPEAIKSTSVRHDDAETDEMRSRRLLLELELIELELETA